MATISATRQTAHRCISAAVTVIVLLLSGIACSTDVDNAERAASLLHVNMPAQATDRRFDVNRGRDGTFVNLEYAVPGAEWRSELAAYPGLKPSPIQQACGDWCSHFNHALPGESHYVATDQITIDDNGTHTYRRTVRVIPDAASGKTWMLWSNDRPPGL